VIQTPPPPTVFPACHQPLPDGCLAIIYSYLHPRSRACLVATSHTARRAVLLCASRISLQVPAKKTGAQLRMLGNLLELPARQPCLPALHLKNAL
jgi:hypothetical protein